MTTVSSIHFKNNNNHKYEESIYIYIYTVEPLITDPPRSGQSLYNGQTLWHGLNLPYLSYIMNLRGVDNLPILYNGRSYGPERSSACKFCSK